MGEERGKRYIEIAYKGGKRGEKKRGERARGRRQRDSQREKEREGERSVRKGNQ